MAYTGKLSCWHPQLHHGCWHPCGKCYECRAQDLHAWNKRATWEFQRHGCRAAKVDLTYTEESVPWIKATDTGEPLRSLRHADWRYVGDRLRRDLRKMGYPWRPFGRGEYGEQRGRPHWHLVFFGVDGDDARVDEAVDNAWRRDGASMGFRVVQAARSAGAATYASKYAAQDALRGRQWLRGREATRWLYPVRPALGAWIGDAVGRSLADAGEFGRKAINAHLGDVPPIQRGHRLEQLPRTLKVRARAAAGIDGPGDKYCRQLVRQWQAEDAARSFAGEWFDPRDHIDHARIAQREAKRSIYSPGWREVA